jgi:hypothetical protein
MFYGVELNTPIKGGGAGSVGRTEYFSCAKGRAVFIKKKKLTLLQAIQPPPTTTTPTPTPTSTPPTPARTNTEEGGPAAGVSTSNVHTRAVPQRPRIIGEDKPQPTTGRERRRRSAEAKAAEIREGLTASNVIVDRPYMTLLVKPGLVAIGGGAAIAGIAAHAACATAVQLPYPISTPTTITTHVPIPTATNAAPLTHSHPHSTTAIPTPATTTSTVSSTPGTKLLAQPVFGLSGTTAMAEYDFTGREADEVTLEEGDAISSVMTSQEGWLHGTVSRTGVSGIFPAVYVVIWMFWAVCLSADTIR